MSAVKDWVPILMAILAVIGALTGAIHSAWRWAKAQVKEEMLRDQSAATIAAKNAELTDLEADNTKLEAENARLWALLQEKLR